MDVLTMRNNMTDPPVERAMRAATGIALSARFDPSRGTRIRLNIACSPFNSAHLEEALRQILILLHSCLITVYSYQVTEVSQPANLASRLYHGELRRASL